MSIDISYVTPRAKSIIAVELDKVIVPSPELESSLSQKSVPVIPTPISEEANDIDHETSDQVTTEPRRPPE